MTREINRVAILGSGPRAGQLAAQFANVGIPALVFDQSKETAQKNIRALGEFRPSPYYQSQNARFVVSCSYDDDLALLGEVDWLIESVADQPEIKKRLYEIVLPHLKSPAIISSNTALLSLAEISALLPEQAADRFLLTRFFDPPRYNRLLEIVSDGQTAPEVVETIRAFAAQRLGKGVMETKDTPGRIAQRFGIFALMKAMHTARKFRLPVEAVDRLLGATLGFPERGVFETVDLLGVDQLVKIAKNLIDGCPEDPYRATFKIPDFLVKMLKNRQLGRRVGRGFYQTSGEGRLVLRLDSGEYHPLSVPFFDGLRLAEEHHTLEKRLRTLAFHSDVAGKFVWEVLSGILIYAANGIPEIADDIVSIDRAFKWGWEWQRGPFEMWDILGLENAALRMKKEGKKVPLWVQGMMMANHQAFYSRSAGREEYFDIPNGKALPLVRNSREILLGRVKEDYRVISENWNARLFDIGEGVLCAEFRSLLQPGRNTLEPPVLDLLAEALQIIPRENFRGLIIASEAPHFSAGMNLELLFNLCLDRDWEGLDALCRRCQELGQQLRYAPFPVVSAPFNLALDSGMELALAADGRVAAAELYGGLAEARLGLVPFGGGSLRLLTYFNEVLREARSGPFPPVERAFDLLANARISGSAAEARRLGYLTPRDRIVMNRDHLIFEAQQLVLELAEGYRPPEAAALLLPGEGGRIALEVKLDGLLRRGVIGEYDWLVRRSLAFVLTGGEHAVPHAPLDEQTVLNLEREAFLNLCREKNTRDRIGHLLEGAGKIKTPIGRGYLS